MKSLKLGQLKKFEHAHLFNHFLWKRYPRHEYLEGGLPEIIATSGSAIRRMRSDGNQVLYHVLENADVSSRLLRHLESNVSSASVMKGYSNYKDKSAVTIMHTGKALEPGWVAYESEHLASTPMLDESMFDQIPKTRLVAGAQLAWERRGYVIKGALEQRGTQFANSTHSFQLLAHLNLWHIEAVTLQNGVLEQVELLSDERPRDSILGLSQNRVEATFLLDPAVCKQLKELNAQIWFRLGFDRELFCLPQGWCDFWIKVELTGLDEMTF